jgi:hypothetical protein
MNPGPVIGYPEKQQPKPLRNLKLFLKLPIEWPRLSVKVRLNHRPGGQWGMWSGSSDVGNGRPESVIGSMESETDPLNGLGQQPHRSLATDMIVASSVAFATAEKVAREAFIATRSGEAWGHEYGWRRSTSGYWHCCRETTRRKLCNRNNRAEWREKACHGPHRGCRPSCSPSPDRYF